MTELRGVVLAGSSLRERVDDALSVFLDGQAAALAEVSADLAPVAEAATEFLSAGKRLRAAFCYWGWRSAGGPDSRPIIIGAACLELLHASALIHDDVMDASDLRRGRPAVHRRFAALHRREGWRGDPEGFGSSAAILLGDLCLIWADQMLRSSGLDEPALSRAGVVYDAMRVELMGGQYLDLLEQAMGGGSIRRSLTVARYKSARYTVERPLQFGALLAGGDERLLTALSEYGLPLGEAFQLRDDVLGVFGVPEETGKPAGDDLREGKRTVLIAAAMEEADAGQSMMLRRHLGDPQLDPAAVAELREIIRETGALYRVETMITERTTAALAALDAARLEPAARAALNALADAATVRTL